MKINIANLKRQNENVFVFEEEVDFINESNEEFKFILPVKSKYEVRFVNMEVVLRGQFTAKIECVCSRCTEVFEKEICEKFEALFYNKLEYDEYNKSDEKEHFFHPDEIARELIVRDEIDAGKVLRESVLLSIPYANICSRECKGLALGNVFE